MSKLPFMQFYPGDWLRDTGELSAQAKAVWIDILSYAWNEPERGIYERSREAFCRQLRIDQKDLLGVLSELTRVASVTASNEKVTVMSRRMTKLQKDYDDNANRQARFRAGRQSNGIVTHKTLEVRKKKEENDVVVVKKNEHTAAQVPAHPKGLSLGPTSKPEPTYTPPPADLTDPLVQKQMAAQDYTARIRAKVKADLDRERAEEPQGWQGI